MSEEALAIDKVVKLHAPGIRSALIQQARNAGHVKSGALARSFSPRIRKDGEDVWGVSFTLRRYGFILHHGVKEKVVNDSSNNRQYKTAGIRGSGFITPALDRTVPALADALLKLTGDLSIKRMNF